jgi:hypothetical protein
MNLEPSTDEFYIGYDPPMPPRTARFVTKVTLGLGGGVLAWSLIAATGHVPLDGGTFEFGHPRQLTGVIVESPYPMLRLDQRRDSASSTSLLVAPGKHGAASLVKGLDGKRVVVNGTRVYRGQYDMFELDGAAIGALGHEEALKSSPTHGRTHEVTVKGEIVDSKCFLGVMVPGEGTTHGDCASLCIRGGSPPALFVKDLEGRSALILLVDLNGEPVNDAASRRAGRPLEMSGTLSRANDWLVLRTDPATWTTIE